MHVLRQRRPALACGMQETLFILEKAGLFGTSAGEVYQVGKQWHDHRGAC